MIAIVNRRQSDLVDKSDGVLFTSDGRDVEMSVASTKAFYSQVAACFLLAFAIAAELSDDTVERRRVTATSDSSRCATLPDAMLELIGRRASIGDDRAAQRVEPPVVGGRRQRREPRRRARDPDQALGALLQVDRV